MKVVQSLPILILFLTGLIFTAVADESSSAAFDKYFSNISEKLSMSPAQVKETKPIFLQSYQENLSIFQKYGFNPEKGEKPGIFKLEDMKNEIDKAQKVTDSKLDQVLSAEQMGELKQIRDQEAKELMNELKEHEK